MLKTYIVETLDVPLGQGPYRKYKEHNLRALQERLKQEGDPEHDYLIFNPREIRELRITLRADGHLDYGSRTINWKYGRFAQYQFRNKRWKPRGRKNYPSNQYFYSESRGTIRAKAAFGYCEIMTPDQAGLGDFLANAELSALELQKLYPNATFVPVEFAQEHPELVNRDPLEDLYPTVEVLPIDSRALVAPKEIDPPKGEVLFSGTVAQILRSADGGGILVLKNDDPEFEKVYAERKRLLLEGAGAVPVGEIDFPTAEALHHYGVDKSERFKELLARGSGDDTAKAIDPEAPLDV